MFPLFDAHCDTASAIYGWDELRNSSTHTDLLRGSAYSPRGQVYALWQQPGTSRLTLWGQLRNFLDELEKNADIVALCRSYADIKDTFAENKQAALLSLEGVDLFGCSEEELEKFAEAGVRIVHLCWNSDNVLCGAAMDSGKGLTEQGRAFVRKCAQLGLIIDLSHISDKAAWDILEMDCIPVMASHSNCRSLCDVPRNLSDELLSAISRTGGVVGLNLYPPFLGGRDLGLAKRHAEHMLRLCGEKNVCLGCDLDGVDDLPEGINGLEDMPYLRRELGFSEELLDGIFFNNLMSFWEKTL